MIMPLTLVITLMEPSFVVNKSILLNVTFKNVSDDIVRILDSFDDQENLPIWFHLQMVEFNGTPILGIRGGGKINLRGTLKYMTLKPGERFSLQLDIAKLITDQYAGDFKISLTYRNQYGQNCFKGEASSNTLVVSIRSNEEEQTGER
jgi:hypothetical protein